MHSARDLVGRPVVQHATGKLLGRVKDLLLDSRHQRLLAIQLANGGWVSRTQGVRWEQVQEVAPDRVVVAGEAGDLSDLARSGRLLSSLTGVPLSTPSSLNASPQAEMSAYWVGRSAAGTVDDITIDDLSGRILGYHLSGGYLQDLLQGRRFVSADSGVDCTGGDI